MISIANHNKNLVYSIVSSLKISQVFLYDNDCGVLWISPPLGINNFLKAAFLVLSLQIHERCSDKYSQLFERIKAFTKNGKFRPTIGSTKFSVPNSIALNDLNESIEPNEPNESNETNEQHEPNVSSESIRMNESSASNDSNESSALNDSNDSNQYKKLNKPKETFWNTKFNQSSLLAAWKRHIFLIGSGRTAYVFKVCLGNDLLAYKMVYRYKPPYQAMEELKNERDVLTILNKRSIWRLRAFFFIDYFKLN